MVDRARSQEYIARSPPKCLAAQAEADAKTILGADATSILTNSTTAQPPASIMPNPGKHSATVSGKLSLSQAKDTANNALNVALAGTDAHLTKIGSTFSLGTANSVAAQANAESDLRRQLALQGYTAAQINAAVTMLKGISSAVGSQTTSSGLSIPSDPAKGIGLGATVTLGLPNNGSTSSAAPLTSNSVIYSNTDESTDTVVKAVNSQTLETYHIIRAKDAPDTFANSLNNLPSGVLLKQVDAQTVEAYLPAKTYGKTITPETVVAFIKAPWAKDANGVSVPTYLTIGTNNTSCCMCCIRTATPVPNRS